MSTKDRIRVGRLKENEVEEAHHIARLAFGTFPGNARSAGIHGPITGNLIARCASARTHVKVVLAAHDDGRLIGTNVVTRWGSFGFFGPLTVLPEYWDRGIAQRLLEATMAIFDRWNLIHTGLFTFAHSAKHVGLYQKFGYWPQYLTAILTRIPAANGSPHTRHTASPALLSACAKQEREMVIVACARLTHKIKKGLDLQGEIRAVLAQRTGEVVLVYTRGILDAFAICLNGVGSEGGEKTCYVKIWVPPRGGERC